MGALSNGRGEGHNRHLLRLSRLLLVSALAASTLVAFVPAARAQSCMTLQYAFQPDCYRPDESSACVQSVSHMDLGPQIAVWLQDSNGAFVDTLMVTNATSVRGIGNRPGRWDFLSGPLFPYGKRVDVAAHLGARPRQDLQHGHHVGA